MVLITNLFLNNWSLFIKMCLSPVLKQLKNGSYIEFPCGGCIGCRLDNLMLWTARCESEFVNTRSAFVTLTYNDIWLNENCFPYKQILPSLIREDFNKFLDRLRVKCSRYPLPTGSKKDFKYFACGEYGDQLRCHYHVLLFGLDFHDCKKLIESCWNFGFVKILPILDGGIRYVVDYFTKNQTGEHAIELYDNQKIERPFKSSSKRLGFNFFYQHEKEISENGFIKIGSRIIFPPSYYVNLFSSYSESDIDSRKQNRNKRIIELEKQAKQNGFVNIFDYKAYLRSSRSKSYTTKFRDKGISVSPIRESSYDTNSLVSQVENILIMEGFKNETKSLLRS